MGERSRVVEHYLAEWASAGWASAYHNLIELGPAILPDLDARFTESRDARLRAALVEIARQMGTEEAIPFFGAALQDEEPPVWKAALDGLVALGSARAVRLLEEALAGPSPTGTDPGEWEAWLREALEQARQAWLARGGEGVRVTPRSDSDTLV